MSVFDFLAECAVEFPDIDFEPLREALGALVEAGTEGLAEMELFHPEVPQSALSHLYKSLVDVYPCGDPTFRAGVRDVHRAISVLMREVPRRVRAA